MNLHYLSYSSVFQHENAENKCNVQITFKLLTFILNLLISIDKLNCNKKMVSFAEF